MSRLGVMAVILALGLTGCGWMHRDRVSASPAAQDSASSAHPEMQGTDKDTLKTEPQRPLQEEQQH